MSSFSHLSKWFCAVTVGSGFGGSFLYLFKADVEKESKTQGAVEIDSSYTNEEPFKIVVNSKWDSNWDKRDPRSLLRPKKRSAEREKRTLEILTPTATRNIFLIRHGEYLKNKEVIGRHRTLTDLGCQQALVLGQRLKDLGFEYKSVIHSTMKRAIETSAIIHDFLPNVPMESTDLLNEGQPVPGEPKKGFQYEFQYFTDVPRLEAAFRKYFYRAFSSQKEDSYEIIVCHSNVIRYIVCRLLQVPPQAWRRFSLHHCSITWVVLHPCGRVTLRSYGDAGFLPKDKMTRK